MAILISIRPEFVIKILNGEKMIEIRKTKPKCELPCKVYIYCKKGKPHLYKLRYQHVKDYSALNGKVVAEFTLDKVEKINCRAVPYRKHNNLGYENFIDNGVYQLNGEDGLVFERDDNRLVTMLKNKDFEKMCLEPIDIYNYLGGYGVFCAWHISNLKIYDKPKELSEFKLPPKKDNCKSCFLFQDICEKVCLEQNRYLFKAPKDWCNVEEVEVHNAKNGR